MTLALLNGIYAAIAAIGFSILFKVPNRFMKNIAFMAFFGFFVRELCSHYVGFGIELSTFFGSVCIGLIGGYFSGRLKVPAQVLTISSAIPMVPGVMSFKAVETLIQFISKTTHDPQLLSLFFFYGSKVLFILGALAFGITVFTMIFKSEV
jgi:uncharacterized membrane protein YjjB (DUF3815 family)